MYISDNIIKWDKNELFIAENQNFDNTGKLIVHFSDNRFLNIELAEYYPQVKKIFFQYKEGEILLNIKRINLNNIVIENPVFIERIVSYMVIKGFLKCIMATVLSFFKSCRFYAICNKNSKNEKANGYYSVLRLADHYQIVIDKHYQNKIIRELGKYFDYEDLIKMEKNEKMMHVINDNKKYRNIWKEKGFDWGGVISETEVKIK